jgi:hypothetical protein
MMTDTANSALRIDVHASNMERRAHRRADMERQEIAVYRWNGSNRESKPFGKIVDISAGGVRIRTNEKQVRVDNQIRLRLELPEYAGISPFIKSAESGLTPKREWIGWMTINRVTAVDGSHVEVAGRLVDMDEMDRGMLGLYLSTQPMAA